VGGMSVATVVGCPGVAEVDALGATSLACGVGTLVESGMPTGAELVTLNAAESADVEATPGDPQAARKTTGNARTALSRDRCKVSIEVTRSMLSVTASAQARTP
jgi:hypothetical protein